MLYCPKCGTQNSEDVKFCRSCGANLSLVPQALTGQMPKERAVGHDSEGKPYDRHGHRIHHAPSLVGGIQQLFLGFGFLIVAAILLLTNRWWGLFMLIPGFGLIGKGVADIVAFKDSQPPAQTTAQPRARSTGEMPPRDSYDSLPPHPPSVTENTTRQLDATREQHPRDTR